MTLLTRLHPYLQWAADQTAPTAAVMRAVQHGSPRPWDVVRERTEAFRRGYDTGHEFGHAAGLAEGERRERELRELLAAFVDARELPGHAVSDEQWERACLLSGRWCAPFIDIRRGDHRQEAEHE